MAKKRKQTSQRETWRSRVLPLVTRLSEWMSGMNRFTVCSKCKIVLDNEDTNAGSTLTWDFGKDGWVCPKCSQ